MYYQEIALKGDPDKSTKLLSEANTQHSRKGKGERDFPRLGFSSCSKPTATFALRLMIPIKGTMNFVESRSKLFVAHFAQNGV